MVNKIDLLNARIEKDIEINENPYLKAILNVIKDLVRTTEIPDYHMPDINAKIGIYLDECSFKEADYGFTIETFKSYVDSYQNFCYRNNLDVIGDNFKKLKEYKGDDSIYG